MSVISEKWRNLNLVQGSPNFWNDQKQTNSSSISDNMSIRGERFIVDLSDDENEENLRSTVQLTSETKDASSFSFVRDIVEREPTAAKPPSAPAPKSSTTGFPEHKKRSRISAFKQQRSPAEKTYPLKASADYIASPAQISTHINTSSLTQKDGSIEATERRRIDEENNQRLAAMSDVEIEQERQELLASLSPSMIENLLKRANLDDGRGDTGLETKNVYKHDNSTSKPRQTAQAEGSTATVIPEPAAKRITAARTVRFEDDDAEPNDPGNLQPVSEFSRQAAALSDPPFHFPHAPSAPELDPSDPSFLESLHTKYFPSLPADPSKLAWMAPIPTHGSVADQDSPYYPGQNSLPPSALRFDFRGGLLPPRIARAVPTTKGLHHHGEAPEAAGYTVPELARLARSAFPAQRCVAFQTLGRLLYRLGRGEWGDEGSEVAMGLWRCIDEGKVIETLEGAASAEGGHQGSKVYAVEAVWLWQKGGGKRWKAA